MTFRTRFKRLARRTICYSKSWVCIQLFLVC
ncbi:MAG: IS1 family transposase [Nitrososphaerota archaeon]|nr:IS1 family transposase [Nitrososphaerota archaeon]